MWVFSQNTIAGDLGVTPIVQCLASMLISSTLVHTDLHNHAIAPLAFCYPHVEHLPDPRELWDGKRRRRAEKVIASKGDVEKAGRISDNSGSDPSAGSLSASSSDSSGTSPSAPQPHGWSYYYWMLVRFIFEGTEQNMLLAKPGFRAWWGRFFWTAAQGAAIGIVFGFPLWCLAIVILGPIYGTRNMGSRWAPQVIKMVYGAIVGWVTNPVIAVLALGSQAECHLVVVEHDEEVAAHEGEPGSSTEAGEEEEVVLPIPTIVEGQEFDPSAHPLSTPSRKHSLAGTQGSLRLTVPVPASPSLSATRTPTSPGGARSRSESNASRVSFPRRGSGTRPPLTANASYLAPLPTTARATSDFGTGRMRAHSNANAPVQGTSPLLSPSSLRGRPRGATVGQSDHSSSLHSPPTSALPLPSPLPIDTRLPPTPRSASYSYALGGTGGRAQRSRSASVVSHVPSVLVVDTATLAAPSAPPSQPTSARPSIISLGPAVTSPRASRPVTPQPAGAPRGQGEGQGGWDVFGRRENTTSEPR